MDENIDRSNDLLTWQPIFKSPFYLFIFSMVIASYFFVRLTREGISSYGRFFSFFSGKCESLDYRVRVIDAQEVEYCSYGLKRNEKEMKKSEKLRKFSPV